MALSTCAGEQLKRETWDSWEPNRITVSVSLLHMYVFTQATSTFAYVRCTSVVIPLCIEIISYPTQSQFCIHQGYFLFYMSWFKYIALSCQPFLVAIQYAECIAMPLSYMIMLRHSEYCVMHNAWMTTMGITGSGYWFDLLWLNLQTISYNHSSSLEA